MIGFILFVCVVGGVWSFLGYQSAYWKGHDKAFNAAYNKRVSYWKWLVRANARRKRVERALRKQRALNDSLHRRCLSLLATCNDRLRLVLKEAKDANTLARSLAGELVEEVLTIEDQEKVTKSLTRKL